jgi:hypothetical protein
MDRCHSTVYQVGIRDPFLRLTAPAVEGTHKRTKMNYLTLNLGKIGVQSASKRPQVTPPTVPFSIQLCVANTRSNGIFRRLNRRRQAFRTAPPSGRGDG